MVADARFMHRLAEAAKDVTLPFFRNLDTVDNKLALGFDPVTDADRQAEAAMRDLIARDFPDHGILGEEFPPVEPDRPGGPLWVLDPIDGTRAFISGIPVWGTLIGHYVDGRSVFGMMDQPFTGERFWADGSGAFYRGPDGERQLKTRPCKTLSQATFSTTDPDLFGPHHQGGLKRLEQAVQLKRYGLDCYSYVMLASGFIDVVVETDLKPYDIAALIAIIEQAGGKITTFDGGRAEQGGDVVVSGDPDLHDDILDCFRR